MPRRDEIRRQVRETEVAHRSALATFRDALDRAFDPASGTDAATKAALVGLPDRRGFLKIGGLAVAASAVLVSCSDDSSTGRPGSTTTTAPDPNITDATLVLTAASIEQLAVVTYQQVIDAGLLKTPTVADVAKYFQQQHRDHAGLLAATATKLGQSATDQPNGHLQRTFVEPRMKELRDEAGALALAVELEKVAAQTYAFAGGVFSVPPLRQAIMTIGGIEARHLAVLFHLQGEDPVPAPYLKTDAAAPRDSYLTPTGAVTPHPSTTTTTTTIATTTGTGTGTTAR